VEEVGNFFKENVGNISSVLKKTMSLILAMRIIPTGNIY
jgi:hypothetical protein